MAIFTYLYKPPPPDEIPMSGEPPIGLDLLKELVRSILESDRPCDHTSKQIKEFLQAQQIEVEPVFKWLAHFGVFCDCALTKATQLGSLAALLKSTDAEQ